ncbi:MAG: hypothetical protein ACRD04_09530 [Terriglobales bacterium]
MRDGKLASWRRRAAPSFADSSRVFASVYEFFTLPPVVFFGCLGLFLRLFRGEMLDRSLHFHFLAPIRREVVLAGKFLAGLMPKHISILYYLVGLLPARLASGLETSSLFALLATSGNSLAPGWDIVGVIAAAALLLCLAAWRVRRLEIDYASD